jgi:hypothetical protein
MIALTFSSCMSLVSVYVVFARPSDVDSREVLPICGEGRSLQVV